MREIRFITKDFTVNVSFFLNWLFLDGIVFAKVMQHPEMHGIIMFVYL